LPQPVFSKRFQVPVDTALQVAHFPRNSASSEERGCFLASHATRAVHENALAPQLVFVVFDPPWEISKGICARIDAVGKPELGKARKGGCG